MAKFKFLNQADSFVRSLHFSICGNAHKENLKIKVLHEESNEKKNSEKYLIKIKARFDKRKEKIKMLK